MEIKFNDNFIIKFLKDENGKNEVSFWKDKAFRGFIPDVSKDWGNYWFKYAKSAQENGNTGEWVSVMMYFDACAYDDDYDFYSDIYKDEYNFRPRLTKEEWKRKVEIARNRKP